MTDENKNFTWRFPFEHPDTCLQESKLSDDNIECEFSKALTYIRRLDLKNDEELVAVNLKRFIHSRLDSAYEQPNIVHEIVQKAVKLYEECQESTAVMLSDDESIAKFQGRSLSSAIKYNPVLLKNELSLQYVFYQIICLLECFHNQRIPYLNLATKNIFVNNLLQVNIAPPEQNIEDSTRFPVNSADLFVDNTCEIKNSSEFYKVLCGWVLRNISNYDYLMYINRLAGRKAGDPTASAVLPWVTDFSSPFDPDKSSNKQQCLRDLTRTKFRLNKGEHQLDATYLHSTEHTDAFSGGTFVPHHLLDMMPNLAYYTYKVCSFLFSQDRQDALDDRMVSRKCATNVIFQ
ncbi:unnamed protein product [Rodentolepis nana]|uniref:BEACH domain-containing protein n=1 Tax=Rodentolepis nana TaxID=102285 RepID=A0A0R3T8Y5_RODNA|nr:unnamed protein product [Rodentolepis nana]